MDSRQLLRNWFAIAVGVLVASGTAKGIYYDNVGALLIAILLLGIFNSFLKPILMLFSLPFVVLTFGIGIWIINAVLFLLVAALVDGFYVESFLSALWGALIISVIKVIAVFFLDVLANDKSVFIKVDRTRGSSSARSDMPQKDLSRRSKLFKSDDDVIDI